MYNYIDQLKNYLSQVEEGGGFGGISSMLDFLWSCYSCEFPVDDGKIKRAEKALEPRLEELSTQAQDAIFSLIVELCDCYRRAAFIEGIQVGARLVIELQ